MIPTSKTRNEMRGDDSLRESIGDDGFERGGVIRVRLAGDRVVLAGQAVTVLRGELLP